ncbi:hypothetical protein [Sphingobacterium sp. UBA5670]|uniref:hypothetical protein n=1 Tax=Sphingobacterium sp. UBA5670 TaxID=1947502 RepID=UPI0025D9C068|nr:hypothetical protein [Sphingobacterium sp. UBA5670]
MKETLLVLDLDETLLYATKDKLEQREDFVVGPYYVICPSKFRLFFIRDGWRF